jgi:hypothetical protein
MLEHGAEAAATVTPEIKTLSTAVGLKLRLYGDRINAIATNLIRFALRDSLKPDLTPTPTGKTATSNVWNAKIETIESKYQSPDGSILMSADDSILEETGDCSDLLEEEVHDCTSEENKKDFYKKCLTIKLGFKSSDPIQYITVS